MKPNKILSRFNGDTRAVTQVLGFILLFGILTIAFTSYQAQIVPQQNAETEFEHFQENQDDLVDLRSSILTAGTSDRAQYPTVELGTNYRTRILALNGPPPAGTLQTTESYPITISNESDSVTVDTRFIEYQPGYSELDVGSTWYENSVLYLEEGPADPERIFIENQSLIDSGTLQITALQNEFQQTGTDRITVELRTLEDETVGNLSELEKSDDLTVEMPTRLNRSYWDDQLSDSEVVFDVGDSTPGHFDSDVNRQNLTVDNVTVNSVGIRDTPDEDPQKNIDPITGSGGGTGDNDDNGDIFYPDDFEIINDNFESFGNMQDEDGNVANFFGEGGGGNAYDVNIETDNLPAGDYRLEIGVAGDGSYQGGGASVVINGETVETIDEDNEGEIVEIQNSELQDVNDGELIINYDGNNQNSELNLDFQRLVLEE